jgi:hypothetical protein
MFLPVAENDIHRRPCFRCLPLPLAAHALCATIHPASHMAGNRFLRYLTAIRATIAAWHGSDVASHLRVFPRPTEFYCLRLRHGHGVRIARWLVSGGDPTGMECM